MPPSGPDGMLRGPLLVEQHEQLEGAELAGVDHLEEEFGRPSRGDLRTRIGPEKWKTKRSLALVERSNTHTRYLSQEMGRKQFEMNLFSLVAYTNR